MSVQSMLDDKQRPLNDNTSTNITVSNSTITITTTTTTATTANTTIPPCQTVAIIKTLILVLIIICLLYYMIFVQCSPKETIILKCLPIGDVADELLIHAHNLRVQKPQF